jgi:hypothetical protein
VVRAPVTGDQGAPDEPLFETPALEVQRDPSLPWWLPLVCALILAGTGIYLVLR